MTVDDLERLALQLSEQDRCDLVRRLYMSLDPIDADTGEFLLSPELDAELERRIADLERNPNEGRPWHEVFAELSARLACAK